jgi:PII-like signaling protein
MRIDGPALIARIYIGESDQWHGRPLSEALVHLLRERGIAGATVFRGVEGFGRAARIHTSRILRLSDDLPVLVEVVDEEPKIRAILPELDAMVSGGLITLVRVERVAYRGESRETQPGG